MRGNGRTKEAGMFNWVQIIKNFNFFITIILLRLVAGSSSYCCVAHLFTLQVEY